MAMRLDSYQAVKEKIVSLDVKPIDSYKRAQVDIRNNSQHDIDLDFSRTAFIPAENSDAQRLGLTYVTGNEPGTYVVSIRARTSGSIQFEARCLDYHRPAPANGLLYVPMLIPLPNLIVEMMKRGVKQQDIWYDIENAPSLKTEWQAMDPRGTKLNSGSIPISATISLRVSSDHKSTNQNQGAIVGNWEGAHPVQDGSRLNIKQVEKGDYKYIGTYTVVGWSLQGALFSVGENGIWLNPSETPGKYQGKLKRRQFGSGVEGFHNVTVVMSNKNVMIATDKFGSFEFHRV